MKYKLGDYVRVVTREQTPADVKSGYFYPFFCGLAGTVDRVYDEAVCVKVDCDSLPADVLKRHQEIQDSIRKKWLDNLSGEARNRLSAEDKRFELAYTILVQTEDLEKAKPGQAKPATPQVAKPEAVAEAKPAEKKPAAKPSTDTAKAVTSDDLDEAELKFLEERKKALEEK